METFIASRLHRPLAAALWVALSTPGGVSAQTAKELEQDARIQKLENELQALRTLLQQASITANDPVVTAPAPASATKNATDGKPPIQRNAILTAGVPGGIFSYGGFIKFDAFTTWTDEGMISDSAAGRLFYVPAHTPVGAGDSASYTDVHAQFSRFWLSADRATDEGDRLKAYLEFDFFGGGNNNVGSEKTSNGYPPTLRHVYVSWNRWLAGQTWSNFMDATALPESADFAGVTDGIVFVRQAQVRYSAGPWSFSLENPQTWYQAGSPAHVSSGRNVLPDATARWLTRGEWGHVSIAGIVRQLRTADDHATGAGLSVAGSFKLGQRDLLQYMATGGTGIGRYVAMGLAPDAYLDTDNTLQAQPMYAGFLAWRHYYGPRLRSTLAYSAAYIDTDDVAVGRTASRRTQSWRLNLFYSPSPKLDVGAEVSWGERTRADDESGELRRLHTTVKYNF